MSIPAGSYPALEVIDWIFGSFSFYLLTVVTNNKKEIIWKPYKWVLAQVLP